MSWHTCRPNRLTLEERKRELKLRTEYEEPRAELWDELPLDEDEDEEEDEYCLREDMVRFAGGMVQWMGAWMRRMEKLIREGVEKERRKE